MRIATLSKHICLLSSLAWIGCGANIDNDLLSEQTSDPVMQFHKPVELYHVYTKDTGGAYGSSHQLIVYDVAVENQDGDKAVWIHAKEPDGTWKDYPANYYADLGDTHQLWRARAGFGAGMVGDRYPGPPRDLEFAIHYTVGEKSYWDNNNNQNYKYGADDLSDFRQPSTKLMVVDPGQVSNMPYPQWHTIVYGTLTLRNLAPNKSVKVVYTTDGWRTVKTENAYFSPMYLGHDYTPNPGPHGTEVWSFTLQGETNSEVFEYAVVYKVDGKTYWDNNFGRNYRLRGPARNVSQLYLTGNLLERDGESIMKIQDDHLWITEGTFGLPSGNAFRIDTKDGRIYGDDDGDGVAELGGMEIPLPQPGVYRVEFNDQTLAYDVTDYSHDMGFARNLASLYLRCDRSYGGPWTGGQMWLVEDHVWQYQIYNYTPKPNECKFDVYNDWSRNYGDDDADGVADLSGANIVFPDFQAAQTYNVRFNDETLSYTITPAN